MLNSCWLFFFTVPHRNIFSGRSAVGGETRKRLMLQRLAASSSLVQLSRLVPENIRQRNSLGFSKKKDGVKTSSFFLVMGPGPLPSSPAAGRTWALAHTIPPSCALGNCHHNYMHLNDPPPPKKQKKCHHECVGRAAEGTDQILGPEPVPATLHPSLAKPRRNKTSRWNEAALVPKHLDVTQLGPRGANSVHRPLNAALGRVVPLVWFCFRRKRCAIPGALLQLSEVVLKALF